MIFVGPIKNFPQSAILTTYEYSKVCFGPNCVVKKFSPKAKSKTCGKHRIFQLLELD